MIKFISPLVVIIIIISALFINVYPNYYALIKTPAGFDFSGQASWFDPWDINVYVATIRWGQNGHLLLENLYSSDYGTGVLLYPVYVFSGFIFRGSQPFLLFQLSALFFGLIFSVISWLLMKQFLKKSIDNIFALFIFLFGGGLGWLFFNKIQSADLYMTGFTAISQLQRPHEAIGMAFYFLALVFFYQSQKKHKFFLNLISLISLLTITFFYPYYYLSYFLICGFYVLLKFLKTGDKFYFKYILINLLTSSPLLYLYYQHLQTNQTFSSVFTQRLATPNMLEIILGYGILTLFLLLQLRAKGNNEERLFLNIWFFLSIFLSYLPFGFSRFYLRGLYFPAAIILVLAINNLNLWSKLFGKIILIIVILSIPISTFYIFTQRLKETEKNNPWFYQPKDVGAVLNMVPQQNPYQDILLAEYNMGNYIPSHSNLKVYFGHFIQTNNAEEKIGNLYLFYGNKYSEKDALNFLKQNNIKYVWYGNSEKQLTKEYSGQDKLKYSFLTKIGGLGNTEVFQINGQNNNSVSGNAIINSFYLEKIR